MIEVRSMTFGDIDEVMVIEKENFSVPWDENGFLTYLLREGSIFLVAEEECRIVGYCGLITAADEGDITNVSVSGHTRGRGIGDALVNRLQKEAKEIGIKKIFLEVRESNEAAIGLYKKNGFAQVGIRKKYYSQPEEDAILMACELGE